MGLGEIRAELLERGFGDRLLVGEPLSRHTSFAIGGPADLLVTAHTLDELVDVTRLCRATGVRWRVLGSGTNILVADAGIRGVVILNACRRHSLSESGLLVAESGVLLSDLAFQSVRDGWAGLAWAVGIPGTLGGAVVGNAGAYGGCVADNLRWVRWVTREGEVEQVTALDMGFAYRSSVLKEDPDCGSARLVLEVAFQLQRGDTASLRAQVEATVAQRQARIPVGCCAGSVFKRTMQYPAGFLIEQAGLKGRRVGGAEVSPHHANFIMNTGNATARDMRALIELVQTKVWDTFSQRLEPEIQFIGEWS